MLEKYEWKKRLSESMRATTITTINYIDLNKMIHTKPQKRTVYDKNKDITVEKVKGGVKNIFLEETK